MDKRPLKDLIPYDKNPRNNKDAVDRVLESLNRHGQVKPIVVSAKGKPFEQEVIVAGHTTKLALERFGAKEAFVVVKEFADEAQFVDYNIRDNKAGEFAQWDEGLLAELGAEFEVDLGEMGFDIELEETTEGNTDEDDVPDVPEEPTAKLGQIWKLGDHRLMCGDSTDRAQVEALMGGEDVFSVVTDPPYGIGADKAMAKQSGQKYGNAAAKKTAYEATDWDKLPPKELIDYIAGFNQSVIFGGNYFDLPPSSCWLVWDKENGDNNFADCELAWTNLDKAVRIKKHMWNGMIRKDQEERYSHPTQKPVDVMTWAVSFTEGSVFEPFAGSGTTLMACEKLKRKCLAVELSPKYIDVIIKRWEDFTGKKAELIDGPT